MPFTIPGERALSVQNSSSDTLSATVITEQDFATTYTLPANYLQANKGIRVTVLFTQTTGGTPATNVFKLRLGTTIMYSNLAATPTANLTGIGTGLVIYIQGTAAPGASVNVEAGIAPMLVAGAFMNRTTQPVAVATNASKAITFSITYGATNGTDSLTLRQMIVEELN